MACVAGTVTLDPSSDQYLGSGLAWRLFRQISYHLNHDRAALREQAPALAAQAKGIATILCELYEEIGLGAELPVGAIIAMATDDDPNDEISYGTWTKVADGRVLVGQDIGDADFDVLEEEGGIKQHNHSVEAHQHDMAEHTHTGPSHTHTGPSHTHDLEHTHTHAHTHPVPFAYDSGSLYLMSTNPSATITTAVASWSGTSGSGSRYWLEAVNPPVAEQTTSGASETETSADGTGATGADGTGSTGVADPAETDEAGADNTDEAQNLMPYYVVTFWKRVA